MYNGIFGCFMRIASISVTAMVIYYGTDLVFDGKLTIGYIAAFLLYMMQLMGNFASLAWVGASVAKMSGASSRIMAMMQKIPGVNTRGGLVIPEEEIVSEIELKNVWFNYPTKQDVVVATNVNLKVEKNKVLALVGASGCGKSSLIALIARLYDPTEGQVLFSGQNIKNLDPRWYHTQVALV